MFRVWGVLGRNPGPEPEVELCEGIRGAGCRKPWEGRVGVVGGWGDGIGPWANGLGLNRAKYGSEMVGVSVGPPEDLPTPPPHQQTIENQSKLCGTVLIHVYTIRSVYRTFR